MVSVVGFDFFQVTGFSLGAGNSSFLLCVDLSNIQKYVCRYPSPGRRRLQLSPQVRSHCSWLEPFPAAQEPFQPEGLEEAARIFPFDPQLQDHGPSCRPPSQDSSSLPKCQ